MDLLSLLPLVGWSSLVLFVVIISAAVRQSPGCFLPNGGALLATIMFLTALSSFWLLFWTRENSILPIVFGIAIFVGVALLRSMAILLRGHHRTFLSSSLVVLLVSMMMGSLSMLWLGLSGIQAVPSVESIVGMGRELIRPSWTLGFGIAVGCSTIVYLTLLFDYLDFEAPICRSLLAWECFQFGFITAESPLLIYTLFVSWWWGAAALKSAALAGILLGQVSWLLFKIIGTLGLDPKGETEFSWRR